MKKQFEIEQSHVQDFIDSEEVKYILERSGYTKVTDITEKLKSDEITRHDQANIIDTLRCKIVYYDLEEKYPPYFLGPLIELRPPAMPEEFSPWMAEDDEEEEQTQRSDTKTEFPKQQPNENTFDFAISLLKQILTVVNKIEKNQQWKEVN